MPSRSDLVEALPCEIGVNRTIARLNGRELSPRAGAAAVTVRGQTGYERRLGLGYILVLPMDIVPVQFADAKGANAFWRSMLAGMARVPGIHEPTEMVLSDEQDILIPGPNAADSVDAGGENRWRFGTFWNCSGRRGRSRRWIGMLRCCGWREFFLLIGPVDSIILMRLGQRPRNWVTIVGWVGLLASVGLYVAIRPGDSPVTVRSLRVVDQVDNSAVAETDIVAVNSPSAKWVRMGLDEDEWWEPANQAARSYGPERFVDASCHEDKKGCRPEWIRLIGGEAQAWHGETVAVGGAVLRAKLRVRRDRPGNVIVSGTLTNVSKNTLSDIQIETADGNCRVGKSLGAGESMEVDEALGNQGIAMNGLPADVGDVAPDRADRVEQMVKSGFGCVYGQMEGDRERREVVRAVVGLGSHGG